MCSRLQIDAGKKIGCLEGDLRGNNKSFALFVAGIEVSRIRGWKFGA